MPERSSFVVCKCPECLERGGSDPKGNPRGFQVANSQFPAHRNRVKNAARRARMPTVEDQSTSDIASTVPAETYSEEVDALTAQLFGTTFADEGPELSHQPNKLWISRSEFQSESSQPHGPPQAPDFSDISATVSRLSLLTIPTSDVPPLNRRRPGPSSRTPQEDELEVEPLVPALAALALDAAGDTKIKPTLHRKEINRLDSRALEVLGAIRLEIQLCRPVIMDKPTLDDLKQVEILIHRLTLDLAKVTRQTTSVKALRVAVSKELAELSDRVAEKRVLQPEPTNTPVQFVSGTTCYDACISKLLTRIV